MLQYAYSTTLGTGMKIKSGMKGNQGKGLDLIFQFFKADSNIMHFFTYL